MGINLPNSCLDNLSDYTKKAVSSGSSLLLPIVEQANRVDPHKAAHEPMVLSSL